MDFLIHWPPGPVVATVQCQGLEVVGEVDEILISSDRVPMVDLKGHTIKCNFTQGTILPTGRSMVECRTHNRDSPG